MPLSDTAVKNAKPTKKSQKLFDGGGMYLLIQPNGGKWWRLKYRVKRKEKLISLGVYPDVSLKAARDKRDDARKQLAGGIDPGEHRRAVKMAGLDRSANSFEVVAREWFAKFSPGWVKSHSNKIIQRFENDVFPWIGDRAIADLTPADVLKVLQRIEKRGAIDTAHRAHQNIAQVFKYAIATGRVAADPSASLKGVLTPLKGGHHAAITDPKAVGGLIRAINTYGGYPVTKAALKLAPMVFVRPIELRSAEWAEFDLDGAQWNIPAERMKTAEPHLVPLAKQAVAILRELHPLTGAGRYVFPGARTNGRPLSDNAINAALRNMGFAKGEMTGHGFRAMARTILDEVLHVRPDYIEHQLAHAVRDPNGRAYNRTAHLPARRKMMQDWANYLDALATTNVVPVRAAKR